jgi:hypothetical protein
MTMVKFEKTCRGRLFQQKVPPTRRIPQVFLSAGEIAIKNQETKDWRVGHLYTGKTSEVLIMKRVEGKALRSPGAR